MLHKYIKSQVATGNARETAEDGRQIKHGDVNLGEKMTGKKWMMAERDRWGDRYLGRRKKWGEQ